MHAVRIAVGAARGRRGRGPRAEGEARRGLGREVAPRRVVAAAVEGDGLLDGRQARDLDDERLGSKSVIQRRFNVSVPRARVPEKASTLRDQSER